MTIRNVQPLVLIDSREQIPFTFERCPTQTATLATGDYSVAGLEHLIAVERKSLADLVACVGRERARFERELQRMQAHRFRLLVVEAHADDLERHGWAGKVTPASVVGSLATWMGRYQVGVWLGGDHERAARFVERYLGGAVRTLARELEAVQQACVEPARIRNNVARSQ